MESHIGQLLGYERNRCLLKYFYNTYVHLTYYIVQCGLKYVYIYIYAWVIYDLVLLYLYNLLCCQYVAHNDRLLDFVTRRLSWATISLSTNHR